MPVFDKCTKTQIDQLTSAFNALIDRPALTQFDNLRESIRDRWNTRKFVCGAGTGECSGLDGAQNSERILICTFDTRRLAAVLLHELVHDCGGSELDSEAIEYTCYVGNGSQPPNGDDWYKFCKHTKEFEGNKHIRVAKFVIWNSTTGDVWVRNNNGGKPEKGTLIIDKSRFFIVPSSQKCS
ncbi:MAG: hypothetical protein JWP69_549 [Flaviaesturariibacter sp.]|nr:hypothetical protein [Flaviaesturariibacter sp.]